MIDLPIIHRRILLRDFMEADRAAFIAYQTNPRYGRLYDFDDSPERPSQLFDLFLQWQREKPRKSFQLAICEALSGRLLGCGGLRKAGVGIAVLGIELAPTEWGRFRLALDVTTALFQLGFETLDLTAIIGDTASDNRRIEKLARWSEPNLLRNGSDRIGCRLEDGRKWTGKSHAKRGNTRSKVAVDARV